MNGGRYRLPRHVERDGGGLVVRLGEVVDERERADAFSG